MQEYIEKLLEIIRSNKTNKEKKKEILKFHDSDIADAVEYLNDEEKMSLYKILGKDEISDIVSYIDDNDEVLSILKLEDQADVLELMDADDAVDTLQNFDEEDREKLINLMDEDAQEDVKMILSYDDEQVGSLMTTNYIAINAKDTIKQAMRKLIKQANENDNISTLVVLNDDETFYGCLDLKELIIARADDNLQEKVMTSYPYVHAESLIDEVINDLKEYGEDIIPVLDKDNKILGVITTSDIVELVDTEATEDYNRFAGLTDQEETKEPLLSSIKKRLPWLIILLGLGIIVSTIISIFSNVIAGVTAAVLFQSVIFDMAGNSGTQSLAVTLTTLTHEDDLKKKEIFQMLTKEFTVGLINGLILGALSFGVVFGFLYLTKSPITVGGAFNIHDCLLVSMSVGISLVASMSISSVVGFLFPVILKKCKVDPAVASGPMITTVNDLCSACIYYVLIGIFFGVLF